MKGLGNKAKRRKKAAEATIEDNRAEMEEAAKWLKGLATNEVINAEFFTEEKMNSVREDLKQATPFPYKKLTNFLDSAFITRMCEEIKTLEYLNKSNDLYQFVQSNDLKSTTLPLCSKFKEVIYSAEFRGMLTKITGIELNDEVDLFAAVYADTDRLLCHDDRRGTRRIAYILYLVPEDWAEEDGGSLSLFDSTPDGEAHLPVVNLLPQWNSFVFFEVSALSYHQVNEVLSSSKPRLSVGGWFHGAPLPSASSGAPPLDPLPLFVPLPAGKHAEPKDGKAEVEAEAGGEVEREEAELAEWINPKYLIPSTRIAVKKQFLRESSIELKEFLRADIYAQLVSESSEPGRSGVEWTRVGPPNKKRYSVLQSPTANPTTGCVGRVEGVLRGGAFARYLTHITGLHFKSVFGETRRFQQGDYTLAHDQDPENNLSGLDVVLCIVPPANWDSKAGGTVHYMAQGEDEELLTVEVNPNTLSLVFRTDEGVLRFVRYVTHRAPSARVDVACVFRTVDDGRAQDEDEDGEGADEADEQDPPEEAAAAAAAAGSSSADSSK